MSENETILDRRIKVRHIQCFVEIARSGAFKTAARTLNLTQPAVSKTLKELEQIVGASLMNRSRAGVALTAQGEVFLHFAKLSLANLQQGVRGIELAGQRAKTRLRIGALPTVAGSLMPQVASEFAALAPDALLEMTEGPHGFLVERLRLGDLDLVVGRLGQPEMMQGLSFTQLYTERVDFVVRAGHPLLKAPDLHRLPDWPVIYPPVGAAIRPLVERLMIARGIETPANRIETVSGAFGRAFTRQSDAVWVISSGVVAQETSDGALKRLPFDTALTDGPVGLMTRAEASPMPVMDLFQRATHRAVATLGLAGAS